MTCASRPSDGAKYRLTCILAGGVQTLPEGVIVIVRLEAAKDTPKGKQTVDLEEISGVSAGLESIRLENVKTPVTIR